MAKEDGQIGKHCSFCGKPYPQIGPMVEGPGGIFMCSICVDKAGEIIAEMRKEYPSIPPKSQKN